MCTYTPTYIHTKESIPGKLLAKPLPQNVSNAILFSLILAGGRRYLLGCDIGSWTVTETFNEFSTNVTLRVKRHSTLD